MKPNPVTRELLILCGLLSVLVMLASPDLLLAALEQNKKCTGYSTGCCGHSTGCDSGNAWTSPCPGGAMQQSKNFTNSEYHFCEPFTGERCTTSDFQCCEIKYFYDTDCADLICTMHTVKPACEG